MPQKVWGTKGQAASGVGKMMQDQNGRRREQEMKVSHKELSCRATEVPGPRHPGPVP